MKTFFKTWNINPSKDVLLTCKRKTLLYLRRPHEELLNVQVVQKQGPPDAVNGHADVRLAVGNFQKLLDVLNLTENNVNDSCKNMCQKQMSAPGRLHKPQSLTPRQHRPRCSL